METKVRFSYVQPSPEQIETMQNFRDKFEALYEEVKTLPSNRGLSIALTHLEEASMWVNKSITNNC